MDRSVRSAAGGGGRSPRARTNSSMWSSPPCPRRDTP